MSDYRVNLDIFSGPLDLLLYLVRKDEVDIYDISINSVTSQYLDYIEMMKNLDIEVAGDFLVMAATLMQIKSAMLLPKAETEGDSDQDLDDPRTELIRQLLEYKKFKDAANLLSSAAEEQSQRHPRPNCIIERLKPQEEPELDIEQVSVWDLLEAFNGILEATGSARVDVAHITDDTPIDLYQIEILHRLQTEGAMSFSRIFESRTNRLEMIGLFLALLELTRDNLIAAEQNEFAGQIYLKALTDEPAEQAVQNAIIAASGESQATEYNDQQPEKQVVEHIDDQIEEQAAVIPIVELPAKNGQAVSIENYSDLQVDRSKEGVIPIVELPAQNVPSVAIDKIQEISNDQDDEFETVN